MKKMRKGERLEVAMGEGEMRRRFYEKGGEGKYKEEEDKRHLTEWDLII